MVEIKKVLVNTFMGNLVELPFSVQNKFMFFLLLISLTTAFLFVLLWMRTKKSVLLFQNENLFPVLRLKADGCVINLNPAAHDMLIIFGEPEGKRVPQEWFPLIRKVISTEQKLSEEFSAKGNFYQLDFYPVPGKSKVKLYGRDITEEKRVNIQQIHSAKMQSVAVLAGEVAHDFNNHLGVILGYAEMIKDLLNEPSSIKLMERMFTGISRARILTGQLLEFSYKAKEQNTLIDLHKIIKDEIQKSKAEEGCRLTYKINLTASTCLSFGDLSQVQKVFSNIISNAKEAIGEKGTIFVESCNEFADSTTNLLSMYKLKKGEYIKVDIADNGCGFSSELRTKVFEPFFTTKEGADGLGLTTAYGIMHVHKGAVCIDSDLGRGSNVSLYFPVCAEKSF